MKISTPRLLTTAFTACAGFALAAPASSQYTTVTTSTAGAIPDASTGDHQMTGDGRYIVFASAASNLVAGDTNGFHDVFLKDTRLDTCERISTGVGGAEPDGDSRWPAVSEDGRFVAFASVATNIVSGDTNLAPDVFLVDRTLGTTTRVSVTYLGTEPASGYFADSMLDVSDDGRFVTFVSLSDDLVSTFTGGATRDVYVRDVLFGTTRLVSIATGGTQSDGGWYPSIDDGGDIVCFTSNSHLIHASDSDSNDDVYVWHSATEVIELVSVNTTGTSGSSPGNSEKGRITPDGRYVVFESSCVDLDPLDTYIDEDVFLRDRTLGTTEVVSLNQDDVAEEYTSGFSPDISADGRYVVFTASKAMTGVPHTAPNYEQIYLRDRTAGTTEFLSIPRPWFSGSIVGGDGAFVSDDGTQVAFLDDAPPQEDPTDIYRSVVMRTRDGSSNLMSLSMYNAYGTGQAPYLKVYDAHPSALTIAMYSENTSGFSFAGHSFDLGWTIDFLGFGTSAADGSFTLTAPAVPVSASGLTFYIETASIKGGVWRDSNYAELAIL